MCTDCDICVLAFTCIMRIPSVPRQFLIFRSKMTHTHISLFLLLNTQTHRIFHFFSFSSSVFHLHIFFAVCMCCSKSIFIVGIFVHICTQHVNEHHITNCRRLLHRRYCVEAHFYSVLFGSFSCRRVIYLRETNKHNIYLIRDTSEILAQIISTRNMLRIDITMYYAKSVQSFAYRKNNNLQKNVNKSNFMYIQHISYA